MSEDWQRHMKHLVSFLGLGPPGSGKTHAINSLRRLFPVRAWNFDKLGYQVTELCKCNDCIATRRDGYSIDWVHIRESGNLRFGYGFTKVTAWRTVQDELNMLADGGYASYGALAVDGLTGLNRTMENYSLQLNPEKKGIAGAPAMHHHMGTMTLMDQVLEVVLGLPIHIYITGHLDHLSDETTKEMHIVPLMTGKRRFALGKDFREVYAFEALQGKESTQWHVLTQPTPTMKNIKTTIGSGVFERYEKPDLAYLMEKAGLIES